MKGIMVRCKASTRQKWQENIEKSKFLNGEEAMI